jgi:hypothetical protein
VRLVVDVPRSMGEEEEQLVRRMAEIRQVDVPVKGFWQRLFG